MSEPALIVQNVAYRYGDRVALGGVSFKIKPGETLGLLGPNGSGKSTLFKLLSTILAPQAGTMTVFGTDVTTQPAIVRRKIGVVFQSPALDKQLTIAENLRYHARLHGIGRKACDTEMASLLERFNLTERRNDLVNSLSGGMRRKVELAKAIMTRTALLLLD
ncbi:MAG: transporter related [Phycisphaerales bacterium]|nr:transporter related [Phycisphaerales bacterium]